MIDWFTAQLSNPTFAAAALVVGSGASAFVMATVLPPIKKFLREKFTVSLTVMSHEDRVYDELQQYLAKQPFSQTCRTTMASVKYDHLRDRSVASLTFGPGLHTFKWDGVRFFIRRSFESGQNMGGGRKRPETISLTALTSKRSVLDKFIDAVMSIGDSDTGQVRTWVAQSYGSALRRVKRPLNTIYMSDSSKQKLVEDITRFRASKDSYVSKGIPYRRGYLLFGPPGTGKSSLVYSLACEFDLPIYVINPATMTGDAELIDACSQVGYGSILLIEDIDALGSIDQNREEEETAVPDEEPKPYKRLTPNDDEYFETPKRRAPAAKAGGNVTLSGILNALDGVAAQEGRLLFITTNHPEKLDPALIRPGRIDRRVRLGVLDESSALAMFRAFFPDEDEDQFLNWFRPQMPMVPAELQNKLLTEYADVLGMVDEDDNPLTEAA